MGWFGLGKKRSSFGKWLDDKGISQQEVSERSGVSHSTISRLCSDDIFKPNMKTASKIIKALRKFDSEISAENFWNE